MEEFENAREERLPAASPARVLTGQMLPLTDLREVDRAALAHLLRDLANGPGEHLHRRVKDREARI